MSSMAGFKARQIPKCGEIWMCRLIEREGSVQRGYRPVFILSNDINNAHSPTLNVVPLTSRIGGKRLPVHVYLLNYEHYGLCKPSAMLIEQITTISADRLDGKIGEIRDMQTLGQICRAMQVQFPVMAFSTS